MKENRRAILSAEVRTLPAHLCRVVSLPENVEQLFVTYLCRIERDLHHFRMPRFIRANVFVSRIRHVPATVTYGGVNHTRDALKRRLHTPKAPRAKHRYLGHGCHPLEPDCLPILTSPIRCWRHDRRVGEPPLGGFFRARAAPPAPYF